MYKLTTLRASKGFLMLLCVSIIWRLVSDTTSHCINVSILSAMKLFSDGSTPHCTLFSINSYKTVRSQHSMICGVSAQL